MSKSKYLMDMSRDFFHQKKKNISSSKFTDNEDPTISGCPSTQTINTDSGIATGTATWTAPTASDNSGSVTLTPDYNSGDSFPIGTTTVTYTATDGSGNSVSTCTFDIIVNGKTRHFDAQN